MLTTILPTQWTNLKSFVMDGQDLQFANFTDVYAPSWVDNIPVINVTKPHTLKYVTCLLNLYKLYNILILSQTGAAALGK